MERSNTAQGTLSKTMKIENVTWVARDNQFETMLWDTAADPTQQATLQDAEVEDRLKSQLTRLMQEAEAPAEQFDRLQLEPA